jgi:UDP-N-acetylmuramoyl-tripeptide--D-alanyl-D-alanine ligase
MIKQINIIIPIKIQLTVLQLEEYNYARFMQWILDNFFTRTIPTKKELRITTKLKLILALAVISLLVLTIAIYLIFQNLLLSSFVFLLLLSQPYLSIGIALAIIKPFEQVYKQKIINKTRQKINSNKNLKVIAITGSFGKTSTKEILYQLTRGVFRVLRTPESFNTAMGISKIVDFELNSDYEFFICELAAYKKGEISKLCYMTNPSFGVLTGISKQHLERFGTLENTISAKFELLDYLENPNKMIFNLDDININKELRKRKIENPYGYGLVSKYAQIKAKNIRFNKKGSAFDLIIKGKIYKVKTHLFGYQNINNILAASSIAVEIGLRPNYVAREINNLLPFPNRCELSSFKNGKIVIVDNTYSSNPAGFLETIKTAKAIKGRKVLVTPGLVELGKEEKVVHKSLGKLTKGVFNKVVLVGNNPRTRAFAKGFSNTQQVEFIKDERDRYFQKLKELKEDFRWIFLENDITQNY